MSTEPHLRDEPVLEHSVLEREVTRDGTTVRVEIYRSQDDPGWVLEVEDEGGSSTVWEDTFESDDAAFAEALRAIDEEGIHSFAPQTVDRAALRARWNSVVAQAPIAEFKRILDGSADMMSFQCACGLFAALASAPELVGPSTWLDMLRREQPFADLAEAQQFANGAMALYNGIQRSLTALDVRFCPAPSDEDAIREFCAGYVQVALSDATWIDDRDALAEVAPLCALAGVFAAEKVAELMPPGFSDMETWLQHTREGLSDTLTALHGYWEAGRLAAAVQLQERASPARRSEPKVGRNDPCPCGSGKKFKKCCAS
ncbi:MAG: hypothetical protein RJA70_1612 [Pseudomonadota bacterium]|jgi:uncharacterized protein